MRRLGSPSPDGRAGQVIRRNTAIGPVNRVRRNQVHAERFLVLAKPAASSAMLSQIAEMAVCSVVIHTTVRGGTLTFVTRLLRGQGVSVLRSVDVVRHLGRATWRVVTVRDHEERGSVSRARRHRAVGSTACAHPVLTVRVRQQAHGEVTGPGAQPEVRPGVRSDPTDGISVEFLEGVLGEVRR